MKQFPQSKTLKKKKKKKKSEIQRERERELQSIGKLNISFQGLKGILERLAHVVLLLTELIQQQITNSLSLKRNLNTLPLFTLTTSNL